MLKENSSRAGKFSTCRYKCDQIKKTTKINKFKFQKKF